MREKPNGDESRSNGGRATPEWNAWRNMIRRCHEEGATHYEYYGGRGIKVCERWRESYASFLAHVGRRPSPQHSLDRINNAKGYRPGNVRWATKTEQANNRRPRQVRGSDRVVTNLSQTSAVSASLPGTPSHSLTPSPVSAPPTRTV